MPKTTRKPKDRLAAIAKLRAELEASLELCLREKLENRPVNDWPTFTPSN